MIIPWRDAISFAGAKDLASAQNMYASSACDVSEHLLVVWCCVRCCTCCACSRKIMDGHVFKQMTQFYWWTCEMDMSYANALISVTVDSSFPIPFSTSVC